MAHTMNATSILRSQRMYDPFRYSQLLGREKSRHLRMSHRVPALGPGNTNQFICLPPWDRNTEGRWVEGSLAREGAALRCHQLTEGRGQPGCVPAQPRPR